MKKSEKTEKTVNKILAAATTEFGLRGYDGGTVNNICKSGINKGLVYHNFSGKDQLYLECLKKSAAKLTDYIRGENGNSDINGYMQARMDFFNANPDEAHILFDALLNPPHHLCDRINAILKDFNAMNEIVYSATLEKYVLRDGVSYSDALSYFRLMQTMLNGYFSSPAFASVDWREKIKKHEYAVPRLIDYMLFGIAKDEKKSDEKDNNGD